MRIFDHFEGLAWQRLADDEASKGNIKKAAYFFVAASIKRRRSINVARVFQFYRKHGIELSETEVVELLEELENEGLIQIENL